ncbi:MAG: hypothetical protein LBG80_09155 [Bacteroidales bacterium]|jgi:hypothetical protein|nr:hypothetical protein [Bacteroidales bacterium]
MNNQKLSELKSLYENELQDKVKNGYTPFVIRMTDSYDGKNGVLFVGKAENMKDKDNTTIDAAFHQAQKGIDKERFVKKPVGKAAGSAYNRVVYQLTKDLNDTKNINSFARTNLYKLSTTKSDIFGSNYEEIFVDIFKKEIELLQPKYVIMLTSGLEKPFLKKIGKKHTLDKADFQSKSIKYIQFDGLESVFITAVHPQGKPEKELVKTIISLINNTEKI